MTYKVISLLKAVNPTKEIVLLSTEQIDSEQSKQYSFKLVEWNLDIVNNLLFGNKKNKASKYEKLFSDTSLQVDVSGFALGSEFKLGSNINYLKNILVARKYKIPVVLMPQSFGPFSFRFPFGIVLKYIVAKILKYPFKIFAREKSGVLALTKLGLRNIEYLPDLVLTGEQYTEKDIFVSAPQPATIKIAPRSVGIIPNQQISKRTDSAQFEELYVTLSTLLARKKYNIYLIPHSAEDISLNEQLVKDLLARNLKVQHISHNLTCIELEKLITSFDFIVASRYHAVVHAYRNSIPVAIIGWADKYVELAALFEQKNYVIDIRKGIDTANTVQTVARLLQNISIEKGRILTSLKDVQARYGSRIRQVLVQVHRKE